MKISMSIRLALGLALIGIATIAVGWYISSTSRSVPEQWQPVNAPLARALEELSAPPESTANANATSTALASAPAEPAQPSPMPSPLQPEPSATTHETRLNLNDATATELERLPGIGPSKAKAIIAYRDQRGGYRSIDELLEVKGIGPKMLEKLLPEVYIP